MAFIAKKRTDRGFTLLELTVTLFIVGLLAVGGLPLFQLRAEQHMRSEGEAYLKEVKNAILSFVRVNKRLPSADNRNAPDGDEDVSLDAGGNVIGYVYTGLLPYADLGVKPADPWGRALTYFSNRRLTSSSDPFVHCYFVLPSLAGLDGLSTSVNYRPGIMDGANSSPFNVAVVFASGGPKDAGPDSAHDPFDYESQVNPLWYGNNLDGYPYYVRMAPTAWFDDLVLYITYAEIYEAMGCGG